MKKLLFVLSAIVAGIMMLSCSSPTDIEEGEEQKGKEQEVKDDPDNVVYMLPESSSVNLTAAQRQFASDNNGFTLKFLKAVNEADNSGKSFIYSPLSITYVLGMVNDAATGSTEQELEQTLGFHQGGIKAVNDYCKNLIDNLPKVDENVLLNIANAIFVSNKYQLKSQFKNDMLTYYNAKAETLNFSSPSTLNYINSWCSEKTQGMIPAILDQVNPDALSYLLNAIYFKANWTSKFDPKNTKVETFITKNGEKSIPLMHQRVMTSYVKNDTYAAVTLPYGSGSWNMTIMLPEKEKSVDDIISLLAETGWSTDYWNNPLTEARSYEVDLKLPRFETFSDTNEMEGELKGILQKMGIRLAFDSDYATIPNMIENTSAYISKIRQKAKIEVDEEGSKMAAVTIAEMEATSVGPIEEILKADFHANSPFVYIVREASSGVILFVGKFTGE